MEKLYVSITRTRKMLELSNASNARDIFFSSSEIYGDPEILENDRRVLPNFASKIKKVFPCIYNGVVHKLELFATSQMQYLGFL
jgi:hypothetical protein